MREGVIRIISRPPARSGYCPAFTALVISSLILLLPSCREGIRRHGIPAGDEIVERVYKFAKASNHTLSEDEIRHCLVPE